MSTEAKTKNKVDMDPKYLAKLAAILLVISAISAALLAAVNGITAPIIAQINAEKTQTAMAAVVTDPESTFTPVELTQEMLDAAASYADGVLLTVNEVTSNGSFAGYVGEVEIMGFQPGIDMIVGIDADGGVTGISIVSMSETSGLGTKAQDPAWLAQFIGGTEPFSVDKDGGTISALTGATVTSRAVTNGVDGVMAAVKTLG